MRTLKTNFMKIEQTVVSGFPSAMWAMRNPMNSWQKSDSVFQPDGIGLDFKIGTQDNGLVMKLIKAGTEHRKFLRLIHVSCFITIPRYIWQELDTYKVATVRNSCSTMHKLGFSDLTTEDFQDRMIIPETLIELNRLGTIYRENKSVQVLREMKQILPEGFLQSATYDMNYETAMTMYKQRKDHRMSEWSGKDGICEWIHSLPMMEQWLHL
jgi:hypothetical protein